MILVITTSNKGGETKSFTAVSIADCCIRRGDSVVLSDSEHDSIQATTTCIAMNSGLQPLNMDAPMYPALAAWKLGKASTGWAACMDDLSSLGFEKPVTVVADTGASQLQAMLDNLPVLGAAVDAGLKASIVFLAGRTEDSTVAAVELFNALKHLPETQRPQVWVLLVDQDAAEKAEFDIAKPFKRKGEAEPQSILDRAMAEDSAHIHVRHVGRWPDVLFNSAMLGRRLPATTLRDQQIGFGTRVKLRHEMLAADRLFGDIVPFEKDGSSKEGSSHD